MYMAGNYVEEPKSDAVALIVWLPWSTSVKLWEAELIGLQRFQSLSRGMGD
jgi:hypothetical protein